MTISIIGAGMAGLLAGRMLLDHGPRIVERGPELPNNHAAVLRFRTDMVSKTTSIPFKKVRVLKAVCGSRGNPVADAIAYSYKVTGRLQPRSIMNLEPSDRFIAPMDFVKRLARGQTILYGSDGSAWARASTSPIISTIPMPALMDILHYPDLKNLKLERSSGWTIRGTIPHELQPDLYATVYFPSPAIAPYRASITGGDIMIEGVNASDEYNSPGAREVLQIVDVVLESFGITVPMSDWQDWSWMTYESTYQKLTEPDQHTRELCKQFILWATAEHNIYSVGRFATWRPKLLLDDVVQDVQIVRKLIEGGSAYEWRK